MTTYTHRCPECDRIDLKLVHHDKTETEMDPHDISDVIARPEGTEEWALRFKVVCRNCDYEKNHTIH